MTANRQQAIRALLQDSDDGMTVDEIATALKINVPNLYTQMPKVFGVYIDRWLPPKRGQYVAVYMCIDTPEDAPHPRSET
jgi:hypothetical protein